MRLDRILAAEAENLIVRLPGVLDSKIVVRSNLNTTRALNPEASSPTAMAIVRYQKASSESSSITLPSESVIRQILTEVVPSLESQNITIILSAVDLQSASVVPGGGEAATRGLKPLAP
ncbi:hypothetical protein BVY02_02630, partial [bacterium J17]